jgi:hypothetical protein
MKLEVASFRGMVPRLAPQLLPDNAAQNAINARLLSGDLEAWRQFLGIKTLANAPQTIYLLNGKWLSWITDVDVARGIIPGDSTFRVYLTGPAQYAQPRWTNYALATTGAEPYPVVTYPLGVPNPDSVPTLVTGVDTSPTSFSVDILDECNDLSTNWIVSSGQANTANYTSLVIQNNTLGNPTPCFELGAENNNGNPAYAIRDFGIADATVSTISVDVYVGDAGGNAGSVNPVMFGTNAVGGGARVIFFGQFGGSLDIAITNGVDFAAGAGGILASAACTGVLTQNIWYTVKATKTIKADGTSTIVAELFLGSALLGTVTATNTFEKGGYCGFCVAKGDDRITLLYDNFLVQASGSLGYVPTNLATSYVFTYVNSIGEESGPSLPSATITRPDGVSVTVTTPTGLPTGVSTDYNITAKRIYRAATGNTGTVFRFVAEIPLATANYVDVLTDAELGEVLASDNWDLPPDDMRGILALPNGVMVGFRRNQLCLSAQNHPHAWPLDYRLNTDTDIVGIANIDNTIVIGTESFPYLAFGNDPAAYSMSKLEVPQACVSKRSFAYLVGIGVVFASPDGLIAVAGTGQVRNLTETVFTRHQWQALMPETILGIAHDDVYHFWYGTVAAPSGWNDANEVGAWAFSNANFTVTTVVTGGGGP